jgi:hypothetical protein
LRRRISNESSPSARAPASICDSVAQATWGQPKPRKAVLGVVFDMIAREAVRACGIR